MDYFAVGTILDNAIECSDPKHPWVVEVMNTWTDPDDHVLYYIIKCTESPRYQHGWYYEGEVEIVDHHFLDKYFQERKDGREQGLAAPGRSHYSYSVDA
ncbi:hypothetical protein SEA_LUCKYSOCKE_132 [Streptomyces phage LuckySocke]|jgi:hypothetical protein|nr:hypothetical protein SEA_LUCKYSOCKE_132 [Streptomyces phage LuckySocke]